MSEAVPKPEMTPYRRLVEKAFADAIPLSAQFELTFRCNHLCTLLLQRPAGPARDDDPGNLRDASQDLGVRRALPDADRRRGALPQGFLQDLR
mgnify:CR=1 FL=1